MKKLTLVLLSSALVLSSFALSGCAVTTAGIKKGDERNFVRSLNDVSAGRAIKSRMLRAPDIDLGEVDVEVAQGIVLLSGNVPDPKFRIEAERIAWSAPNITEIGNEIKIKSSQGFVRNTKDGILNKSVKTRLIASKSVKARNFNVETHDGIVYLLGVARTQEELERAARIASTTRGAREVVSYVKLADNAPASQPQYPAYQPSSANVSSAQAPQYPAPQYQAPQYQAPQTQPPQYRPLPQALSLSPSGPPAGAAIPLSPPASLGTPVASGIAGQSFPSDEELGKYRVGTPGEAVSVIESEPYYVDPETGREIPIKYLKSGPR
jgi:osmotically-inducible protein OsmY